MPKHLSLSESTAVQRHTFSSILDEPLDDMLSPDTEAVAEDAAVGSNDDSATAKGKNIFSVPNLRSIEGFIYYNCRDQVVAALNEKLYEGELSSMLRAPIIAHEIKRESCLFNNYTAWWLNQTDFLVDVDITLTNILTEGADGDQPDNYDIFVTFWFTTCVDFE